MERFIDRLCNTTVFERYDMKKIAKISRPSFDFCGVVGADEEF
jgi:hypothetical protein